MACGNATTCCSTHISTYNAFNNTLYSTYQQCAALIIRFVLTIRHLRFLSELNWYCTFPTLSVIHAYKSHVIDFSISLWLIHSCTVHAHYPIPGEWNDNNAGRMPDQHVTCDMHSTCCATYIVCGLTWKYIPALTHKHTHTLYTMCMLQHQHRDLMCFNRLARWHAWKHMLDAA